MKEIINDYQTGEGKNRNDYQLFTQKKAASER